MHSMLSHALLALLLPLGSATLIALFLRKRGAIASYLSTTAAGLVAAVSIILLQHGERFEASVEWLRFGGIGLDALRPWIGAVLDVPVQMIQLFREEESFHNFLRYCWPDILATIPFLIVTLGVLKTIIKERPETILVNEAADLIPVSCLTPRPWPHRRRRCVAPSRCRCGPRCRCRRMRRPPSSTT